MHLIKSEDAYTLWSSVINRTKTPPEPPTDFPCFAYLTNGGFGRAQLEVKYVYLSDIKKMSKRLLKLSPMMEPKAITASQIGRLGGISGSGESKRRSKDHYAKMAAAKKRLSDPT